MSIFGNSSSAFASKPAGTSMFGNAAPAQPSTSTSIFGNNVANPNPGATPAATNIFGGGTGAFGQQPQQPQAGGASIFGQSNTGGTGTSLFGGQNNQQQQQQSGTGTGLFGQSSTGGASLFGGQNNQQQQSGTGTGLFGQSNTAGAGGGLFGQNQQQQQQQGATAPGSSLFGAQSNTGGTVTGSSLFGGQSNAGGTGTGLFGQSNQQQQSGAGTGLFGQSNTGGTGTNMFGSQNNQQQQGATANGSSLFGQSNTGGTGTNLFGNTGGAFGQNTQQSGIGASLFGQNTGGTANNLFGQSQQQPQQTTSLFGGTSAAFGANTQQNASSLWGKPVGQQQTQPNPQQPPPFTKTTKFNDLPDEIKKIFEQIDTHIQGRVQISKDLHQRKLGEEATKGQELIRSVHRDLAQTSTAIRNDLQFTKDLKAKADQAVQDTIVATRIIDGFRNTQANGAYLKDHATFPLEFFTRITRQTKERLAWYKSTIEQIERKLSSMANQPNITPQRIVSALQAQHATFLALAGRTASLDGELQKIKAVYTQLWRARTGSVRDPFDGGADIEQSMRSGVAKGDHLTLSALNIR